MLIWQVLSYVQRVFIDFSEIKCAEPANLEAAELHAKGDQGLSMLHMKVTECLHKADEIIFETAEHMAIK